MFYFNFNLCIWEKLRNTLLGKRKQKRESERGAGHGGGAMRGVKWCLDDDVNGDGDEET